MHEMVFFSCWRMSKDILAHSNAFFLSFTGNFTHLHTEDCDRINSTMFKLPMRYSKKFRAIYFGLPRILAYIKNGKEFDGELHKKWKRKKKEKD